MRLAKTFTAFGVGAMAVAMQGVEVFERLGGRMRFGLQSDWNDAIEVTGLCSVGSCPVPLCLHRKHKSLFSGVV